MKVFVSSLIRGYADFRDAAAAGIRALGYEPIRAEDFGASPDSPQQTCLAGVRDSDMVVLLLGATYGEKQESGLSATHEEYREARDNKPVFLFLERGVEPDPDQAAFIEEVQGWEDGHYTERFETADELRDQVTHRLHNFTLATDSAAPLDTDEITSRATANIPSDRATSDTRLVVAVAGGPHRAVLRPAELEQPDLGRFLVAEALTGAHAVLDHSRGTNIELHGATLRLLQDRSGGTVSLSETGEIMVDVPAVADDQWHGGIPSLIEEDIEELIGRALRFVALVLDHIDPVHRLTDVVPVVALRGAGYRPWRTREEQQRNPNTATVGTGGRDRVIAILAPPSRRRAALTQDTHRIAQDLTVRLRRDLQQ